MIDWETQLARALEAQNDGESHREIDLDTFHPSQLAYCPWQATKSKLGLSEHDVGTLGTFKVGTLVHSWIEETFQDGIPGVEFEKAVSKTYRDQIKITGHTDCYDPYGPGTVYDFKTRNGWYKFDPPSQRHKKQLSLYMDMVGAEQGQVVYLNKKDLEVRTWPEDGYYQLDHDVVEDLIDKAMMIKQRLAEDGIPDTVDDIPFDRCGCWICDQEGNDG